MNLNIKATGTRDEIAAMLRELAAKIETGQTPEGADEPITEPIQIERDGGEHTAKLIAEPRKRLAIVAAKPKEPEKKADPKKADPIKRAALCLKRAIAKAGELVAALREVFPAATGAAIMVLEDILTDAVKLAQKLIRLDSLETERQPHS